MRSAAPCRWTLEATCLAEEAKRSMALAGSMAPALRRIAVAETAVGLYGLRGLTNSHGGLR